MQELRVPKLLAGALASVSAAVFASFFGVGGTLIGAAVVSVFVAVANAVYEHSLTTAASVARRSLARRANGEPAPAATGAHQAGGTPIRWPRVAAAAVLAFAIAVGAVTVVEAGVGKSLASLLWDRKERSSTSVGCASGSPVRSCRTRATRPAAAASAASANWTVPRPCASSPPAARPGCRRPPRASGSPVTGTR